MERPINQRIKFLLEALQLSARDFSRAIGVADNNTQNYLEPRFAQPKADYLEKVLLHFGSINSSWLLTGEGEPFRTEASPESTGTVSQNKKIIRSMVVGKVGGNATHNQGSDPDALRDKDALIEQLRSQLADKERTIQILLGQTPRP